MNQPFPDERSHQNAVQMLREEYRLHFGRELANEDSATALAPLSHRLLAEPEARIGLALSGGGIRSATFALGVLQALSRLGLLSSIHYLSTVSGGGYIGGWLMAWAHRQPGGIGEVMEELGERTDRSEHESPAVFYLRQYSNYLTPRIGLFSVDTWTLIGTYFRNLLVNWVVLVPYFALLFLVPVIGAELLREPAVRSAFRRTIAIGLAPIDFVTLASLVCLVFTMAVVGNSLPTSVRRDGGAARGMLVACTRNDFLVKALLPLLACAIGLATVWHSYVTELAAAAVPVLWLERMAQGMSQVPLFVVLGILVHAAAFLVYLFRTVQLGRADSRHTLGLTDAFHRLDVLAVIASGAFGGWLMWLAAARILPALQNAGRLDPTFVFVVSAVPLFLLSFVIAQWLYIAFASRVTSEEDREWFARAGAWMFAAAIAWAAVSGIALLGPAIVDALWQRAPGWVASLGGVSGGVSLWLARSAHTRANGDQRIPATWTARAAEWSLALAAPAFVLLLAALLAAGIARIEAELGRAWGLSPLTAAALIAAGALAVIAVVTLTINVNVFSLHEMYRARLVRAFLGASRRERRPQDFSDFDPDDNVSFAHLAWPLLCARDWPLVHALAQVLGKGRPEEREALARIEDADRALIPLTLEIEEWADPRLHGVIDRFNHVLIYSQHAHDLRREWSKIVAGCVKGSEFGTHEWWTVRAIAAEIPGHPVFGPIVAAVDPAWCADVAAVGVWEREPAAALTARLNAMTAGVATEGVAGMPAAVAGTRAAEGGLAPGPFVPLDPAALRELVGPELRRAATGPLLIMNTAINLVSGEQLAWQERKAASFTFTPLHAGSVTVGYRRMVGTPTHTACYGGASGSSLGTVMTISGAAANPNMGYHSSPVITLLLTLFNARLGAWIGNPRDAKTFGHSHPRHLIVPTALREAFGLTHAEGPYIHLSDGGHFENLGLYELVRRGCRYVLVSDAGCDQQYAFEDLGNAVRKIRIDLGIDIDFQGFRVGPGRHPSPAEAMPPGAGRGEYIALGTIHYRRRAAGAENGMLLYVKPAVFEEDEPIDVRQYRRANPAYPHESTADQWFSESQFESYRALGEYIMEKVGVQPGVADPAPIANVGALFEHAQAYLKRAGAVPVMTKTSAD